MLTSLILVWGGEGSSAENKSGRSERRGVDNECAYTLCSETRKWYRLELSTPGAPRQGHSAVLRGESVFLFGGIVGANPSQLDLLSLGMKDSFEDDIFQEAVQDEEVARQQALPRPLWEAMLLKKHPDILQYRELTRRLTGVNSYGRARNSASTEDPAHMNHEVVLNLTVECLHVLGCSRSANAIIEESKVPCIPTSGRSAVSILDL